MTEKEELWKHEHIFSEKLRDLIKELIQQSDIIEIGTVLYIDISLQMQKVLEDWPEDKRYKCAVHHVINDGFPIEKYYLAL